MKHLLSVCLAAMTFLPAVADDAPALSDFYGFRELEVFKVSERSGNLLSGDMNHDGLTDLVIADNSRHRIDLWIQRKTPPTAPAAGKANDITDSWRFEQQKLAVDQELFALTLGDFNGDGRTDVAYYGAPDKLIIRFQPEKGEWKDKTQQRLPDVAAAPWCLAAGDLDHNGMDDLVVLGKHETTILYQKEKGSLTSGTKLLNTSDKLGLVQVADLDGDGRHDLCYLAGDGLGRVLCCRLQSADGLLGPEYVFDLERPRAVTLRDVDGKPGYEILTIDSRTGRLKMFQVRMQPVKPGELPERLIAYGFGKQGAGKDRDWSLADFDGDKLTDLVVSDPGASRVLLFRQFPQRGLDLGTPFSALSDIEELHVADFDRDGRVELVVHSGKEKIVGVSRYEEGRITFPTALAADADVAALEVADVDGDGGPELAILSKVKKGKETEYQIQALKGQSDGEWSPIKLGKDGPATFTLKGTPERLQKVDLNRDNRADFVIFQGTSKPPQVFLSQTDGGFSEVLSGGSLSLPAVNSSAVSLWPLKEETGLLVSQENFARLLTFHPPKQWQVADQFNIAESNAGIAAAVPIELDGQGDPELALVDTGVKKLRLWKKTQAVYAPWKEIDLGEIALKGVKSADLNGDGRADLALFGTDKVSILYTSGSAPVLQEVASFESQLEKVYPTDVVAGDLNGDGKVDLAMTDNRNHYIELLNYSADKGIRHALYFRLFEQKNFAKEDAPDTEPREALVADVTGDHRADLILLAHDRILVYPQDDGKTTDVVGKK